MGSAAWTAAVQPAWCVHTKCFVCLQLDQQGAPRVAVLPRRPAGPLVAGGIHQGASVSLLEVLLPRHHPWGNRRPRPLHGVTRVISLRRRSHKTPSTAGCPQTCPLYLRGRAPCLVRGFSSCCVLGGRRGRGPPSTRAPAPLTGAPRWDPVPLRSLLLMPSPCGLRSSTCGFEGQKHSHHSSASLLTEEQTLPRPWAALLLPGPTILRPRLGGTTERPWEEASQLRGPPCRPRSSGRLMCAEAVSTVRYRFSPSQGSGVQELRGGCQWPLTPRDP